MKQRPEFFFQLWVARLFMLHFKTITMKTFGVVREENKKSTRKKMP
jgi:hypothetical protein